MFEEFARSFAGHDSFVVSQRARGAVEPELSVHAGLNIHLHGLHFDSSESVCVSASHVWSAYDGAVQRPRSWRAIPARVCNSRLSIQADEKRREESINSCKPLYQLCPRFLVLLHHQAIYALEIVGQLHGLKCAISLLFSNWLSS